MNNNLKLAGAAAGSFIAGYFFANYRNEKFYFDRANEEAEAIRLEFVDKLDQAEDRYEAAVASADAAHQTLRDLGGSPTLEEASEALQVYQGNGGFEPVDIHRVTESETPTIQFSDYTTEDAEKLQPRETTTDYAAKSAPPPKIEPKKGNPTVEVLTSKEMLDNPMDYVDSTLIYYAGDNVLVGGRIGEGVVGDVLREQMLGDKNDVLQRDELWEKEDFWYFRNHALKYDFEITRETGKYADTPEAAESSGDDG